MIENKKNAFHLKGVKDRNFMNMISDHCRDMDQKLYGLERKKQRKEVTKLAPLEPQDSKGGKGGKQKP